MFILELLTQHANAFLIPVHTRIIKMLHVHYEQTTIQ